MSKQTKEKRKKQQLKKEIEVQEEKLVFDVFDLLQHENLDTKPNMAKFLKDYVKSITGFPKVKPMFYPAFELDISKWFIKFLDGHELIVDPSQRDLKWKHIFCYGLDAIEIDNKERQLAEDFFQKLQQFKFLDI